MACCQGAANLCGIFFNDEPSASETLGVLAFDAAKTMCRLVSLYRSLSDIEIHRLRRHVIRSKSVSHLNSHDECFLLNLASAERLEDLNLTAATVSHLARNCSDKSLVHLDAIFAEIKHGVSVRKLEFGTREVERKIENMESLLSATRSLNKAMDSLAEMESSEKKIQMWRTIRSNHGVQVKVECFNDKIIFYRRQVNYYKQVSLWNQKFDKVVRLMAKVICIVYTRMSYVFGSLISGVVTPSRNRKNKHKNNRAKVKGIYRLNLENRCCRLEHRDLYMANLCLFDQNEKLQKKRPRNSCHMLKRFQKQHCMPHSGEWGFCDGEVAKNNRVFRLAPPSTVGGAGLSLRYANLILLTERCMQAMGIGDEVRDAVYDLLPGRLKMKLTVKLRNQWKEWNKIDQGDEGHSAVAEQWQHTIEEVMEWLTPVAHNMLRWQAERNLEKQKFETRPTVLLLQTLHYSNLEKVEEAIVEVLVGLSCVCWYQNQL